jgi:hypothetical protein
LPTNGSTVYTDFRRGDQPPYANHGSRNRISPPPSKLVQPAIGLKHRADVLCRAEAPAPTADSRERPGPAIEPGPTTDGQGRP